ncbi:hypothetical protein GCM10009860_08560 [Microbacterium mitrae]
MRPQSGLDETTVGARDKALDRFVEQASRQVLGIGDGELEWVFKDASVAEAAFERFLEAGLIPPITVHTTG